jgi:hypothetical protein
MSKWAWASLARMPVSTFLLWDFGIGSDFVLADTKKRVR